MSVDWRRATGVHSRGRLVPAVVMAVSYPVALAAALVPSVPLFVTAVVAGYVADIALHQHRSALLNRLSRARAGESIRFLVRQLLVALLCVRLDAGAAVLTTALTGAVLFYAVRAPHAVLLALYRRGRRLPFASRNIDLTTLGVPDAAPRVLAHRASERILHTELPLTAGVVGAAVTGRPALAYAGAALALLLALVLPLALAPYLRASRRVPPPDVALGWLDGWLRDHRPTVALYFSGSPPSAYQLNMWLPTLERLDARPLVILRERALLPTVATTTVPVLCVPRPVDLMNLDLSTLRVGLYPANVGKNLHLLRVPTMKHVFIGHGDSDKIASVNPYAKVYDEVWTAGPAGRERFALADVGARDEDIVEVGRPQLAPVARCGGIPAGRIPTVLYAPTWEGWTDDPGNTSLLSAGEAIVRGLLESDRPVRLLYKPHPLTGTRLPEALATHRRIVALIDAANARAFNRV